VRVVAIAGGASLPPLFTAKQAHAGAAVYAASCIQCHGADLQGTAGPSVAGNDFLGTAKTNHWHLNDLRTTVVQNMPFSDPGSLTPKQYANVLAFLLASNCYPAGTTPFPTTDRPTFASLPLGPHPAAAGAVRNAKTGTCPVK
jgi:cytochrome c